MTCNKMRTILSAYHDGELSEREARDCRAHLQRCAACAAEFAEIQGLTWAFSRGKSLQAPAGFGTAVNRRIAKARPAGFSFFPFFVRFAEAGAVGLVIAAGIVLGSFFAGAKPSYAGGPAAQFSLDLFTSAPPGSLADAYLKLTGAPHEK